MADETTTRDLTHPLVWTTAISGCGSLAAALRSRRRLTVRQVVAAVLTSMVAGMIVALLLARRMGDDELTLIGVSSLAGVGGAGTLEVLLEVVRLRAGIPPKIDP